MREEVGAKKPFLATLVDGGTGWEQFEGCDLVLEAVFEELDVKREVFAEVRRVAPGRDPRDEHVVALRRGDGRRRRAALLQPGRAHAARRDRAHAADDRRGARHRVGRREEAEEARRHRRRRAGLRRQPRPHARHARAARRARERQHGRGDRRGDALARACRWRRRSCCRWSARASRTTCSRRCTRRTPTASRSRRRSRSSPKGTTSPCSPATRAGRSTRSARTCSKRSADEIRHLLDEGVVGAAADVDACLILGAGYPFFLGGITKHLDQSGHLGAGVRRRARRVRQDPGLDGRTTTASASRSRTSTPAGCSSASASG